MLVNEKIIQVLHHEALHDRKSYNNHVQVRTLTTLPNIFTGTHTFRTDCVQNNPINPYYSLSDG